MVLFQAFRDGWHLRGLLILFAVLTLSACGEGSERAYNPFTTPAVEEKAAALFAAMKSGDDAQLIQQYNKAFFTRRPEQAWVDEVKAIMAERGPMQSHHLRKSQGDTRFSGKFYILEYETVHMGNKRLHHLLTFLLPVEGGEIQLNGHKITPWEAEESVTAESAPKT